MKTLKPRLIGWKSWMGYFSALGRACGYSLDSAWGECDLILSLGGESISNLLWSFLKALHFTWWHLMSVSCFSSPGLNEAIEEEVLVVDSSWSSIIFWEHRTPECKEAKESGDLSCDKCDTYSSLLGLSSPMINRLVLCRVYYLINLFKGLGDTGSVRWFLLPLLLYIPFSISLPSFPRISSPGWAQVIGPLSQFRLADEVVLDCGLSSV